MFQDYCGFLNISLSGKRTMGKSWCLISYIFNCNILDLFLDISKHIYKFGLSLLFRCSSCWALYVARLLRDNARKLHGSEVPRIRVVLPNLLTHCIVLFVVNFQKIAYSTPLGDIKVLIDVPPCLNCADCVILRVTCHVLETILCPTTW